MVLHMYVRGLHKLRMSYTHYIPKTYVILFDTTVSASMQLRVFEPYFTDFCPVKEILDELTDFLPFRFVTRYSALTRMCIELYFVHNLKSSKVQTIVR